MRYLIPGDGGERLVRLVVPARFHDPPQGQVPQLRIAMPNGGDQLIRTGSPLVPPGDRVEPDHHGGRQQAHVLVPVGREPEAFLREAERLAELPPAVRQRGLAAPQVPPRARRPQPRHGRGQQQLRGSRAMRPSWANASTRQSRPHSIASSSPSATPRASIWLPSSTRSTPRQARPGRPAAPAAPSAAPAGRRAVRPWPAPARTAARPPAPTGRWPRRRAGRAAAPAAGYPAGSPASASSHSSLPVAQSGSVKPSMASATSATSAGSPAERAAPPPPAACRGGGQVEAAQPGHGQAEQQPAPGRPHPFRSAGTRSARSYQAAASSQASCSIAARGALRPRSGLVGRADRQRLEQVVGDQRRAPPPAAAAGNRPSARARRAGPRSAVRAAPPRG